MPSRDSAESARREQAKLATEMRPPTMPAPSPEPVADPSLWTGLNHIYVYADPHVEYCRCSVQCGKGEWHTQPIGSAWRLRDRVVRVLGWHCWDCWRL